VRVESGCVGVGGGDLGACLIGLERERIVLGDLSGRVVLGIVGGAGRAVGVVGVAHYCRKRCIVVVEIEAEAVVDIGAGWNVFVVDRHDLDGCQVVLGLCPCSIRLLPFVFGFVGRVSIEWR
jgi:hypothetical protein